MIKKILFMLLVCIIHKITITLFNVTDLDNVFLIGVSAGVIMLSILDWGGDD